MRYWWVNQNQTYAQEISGGYLWSPKRKANGDRNAFYESMREVAPGDIVFSFRDTRIAALGIVRSYCYESPKPTEFGSVGGNWGTIGWKVEVAFRELASRPRPKDHMGEIRPLLPPKYSPLRPNGDGLQSVYLTEINVPLAAALFRIIGDEANQVTDVGRSVVQPDRLNVTPEPTLEEWSAGLNRASRRTNGWTKPSGGR